MTLFLSVGPIEAMPGTPVRTQADIRNDGTAATFVSLTVAGIDPGWVDLPPTIGPIAPGESVQADIAVVVPAGHPACQLTGALTARSGTGETAHADIAVTVLDGSVLSAVLDPADVRGGMRGRASLVLRNRGASPVRVDLEASAPEPQLRVRFKGKTRVVQAGQEVRVPARLSAPQPLFGAVRHRPFVLSVRTRGTPVQLEGAFLQRAVFAPWMTKFLAIVAVVALWATVAVVGISSISKHTNKTAQQNAVNNAPPVTAVPGPSAANPSGEANPAAPAGGSGSGGGGGGSGGGGGGSGGGGASGGGSGSSGGGGASTTAAVAPSRVSGKVAATQPGGVTVTLQPTSSGGTPTQASTVSSGSSSNFVLAAATFPGPLTKLYGADLPAVAGARPLAAIHPAAGSAAQPSVLSYSTTTSPDGFWTFAAVPPGSYTVSFSKAGYSVASYVVQITGNGQAVSLASKLVPGNGSASGTVSDSRGPLGGVQLTITDGTVTLTTRTPTAGKVGTWAVNGLPTPGTYLVTASDPGYSNQITLFSLGAGGSANGLKLTMVPGQGSLSGTVLSARNGQPQGGLTVTATNGSITRTTTTTTTGVVGSYILPDLPVPGTYALTISGPGFVTQTQQAVLSSGSAVDNATVNATVTPSGADVNGVATDANGQGLPAAGAILSNQTNVFKTLTTSSGTVGSFDFGQVPPGSYVLSVEDFGYATQSAQVTVASGQVQTVNLSLPTADNTNLSTATIQGTVLSLVTARPIIGAAISLDGQPSSITTDANGAYSLSNVGPGTHTVTASCPSAGACQSLDLVSNKLVSTEYNTTSTQVAVALGAVIVAPQILMPKLDQLAGIVIDGNGDRVPNPTVTLKNNLSGVSYTANSNPTGSGATAPQGGFEFDNLPSGTYTMTVTGPPPPTGASAACPGVEQYETLTSTVDLQQDTNYLFNGSPGTPNASPVLKVLPQYRVTTNVEVGGGTPTATKGVTVEVKATTPGVSFDQTCIESTSEPVIELPVADIGDTFTASFTYASPPNTYAAPTSAPFTANYNNALVDTALLVPPTPNPTVTLSYLWRLPGGSISCTLATGAVDPCPDSANADLTGADFPTATLTGSFVQPGGTTATSTVTASLDEAGGIWSFSAASLVGLLPGPVTFTVTGGAFQTLTVPANTSDANYTKQAFSVSPRLSPMTGSLSEPTGGHLSPAIQVAPSDPNLVVSAATSGSVVWQQLGQTVGQAFPGIYDVTLSEGGYDSTVIENFRVPLCTSSCPVILGQPTAGQPTSTTAQVSPGTITYTSDGSYPITMAAHMALSVTPVFTPITGLSYPTVTVTDTTGTVVGSQQLSSANGTATFNALSATSNDYTVTVSAPSFVTSTSTVTLPFQPSTTYVATDDPTLTALGYLTGVVQGLINTSPVPLAGATVTATLTNPNTCSGTPPTSASGKTLADGSFSLTSSTPGYAGFCVGAAYVLTVTPPSGYATPSTYTGSVGAGDTVVNGSAPIQLQALRISQTFTVTDGTNSLPGVTVTGTSVIGRPVTASTGDGTTGTLGAATVTPDPTTYTYTFQLAGYASYSETVSYIVGETTGNVAESAPLLTVDLAVDHNTISGVVTTPGSCGSASPCPVGGVTLSLFYPPGSPNCLGSTSPCAVMDSSNNPATATSSTTATTTSAIGSYSFGSPTVNIPDGSYLVKASLANWEEASTYQEGLVTSPSLLTVKNVSIVPSGVPLSVTVDSNLSTLSFSGATVSLVPSVPPAGLALPCAAGGSPTLPAVGEGTSQIASAALSSGSYIAYFSSVTPDYYTVSVQSRGLPAQGSDAVIVCPGGNVAEFAPAPSASSASPTSYPAADTATFEALAGQISGTVAVSANSSISASSLSVYITPHSGSTGTTDTVAVTCSSPCTQGTFTSDPLSLGTPGSSVSYDVYAESSVTGYAYSAPGSVTFSASNPPSAPVAVYAPTPTFAADSPLTVAPVPVEVQVTVGDANNSNAALSGVHVTLTDTGISTDNSLQALYGPGGLDSSIGTAATYTSPAGTYTQITNSSGIATFNQVVPDPNGNYTVTVCSGTCTTASPGTQLTLASSPVVITVSIGQNSNNNQVEAYYSGSISGSVYDINADLAGDSVYLCSSTTYNNHSTCNASDADQKATLSVATGATHGSYTFNTLVPGTWYVASNQPVEGSTTTKVASVDVGPGAAITASSSPPSPTFVATTGITVTVNGNGGDQVTICVADPAASPCSSSVAMSQTVTLSGTSGHAGSANYTFSPIAVSPPTGQVYYVTAVTSPASADPSSQTITVLPGVSASSQSVTLAEPTYTVTYDGNGATGGSPPVDSNTYYHAGTATVLGNTNTSPLTKTGYTFAGWNITSTGSGTSYVAGDTITMSGNVTLYAVWNPDLSYNANATTTSGTVPPTTSYAVGTSVTLPGNTGSLVYTGYTFQGWSASTTGTAALTSPYTMPSSPTTLYAVWYPNLTFDANTGSGTPPPATAYAPGAMVTLPTQGSLTKTGYTFEGWSTTTTGSALTSYTMPATPTTLYAVWGANMYTVTYDPNGATSGAAPVDSNSPYAYGATVTVLDNTGSMTNGTKTFQGWNTQANGRGTSYSAGATFTMPANNVTLYAVWK